MDELIKILQKRHPEINFETEERLVEHHVLDSFDIIMIVSEVMQKWKIKIPPKEMTSGNFNSARQIWSLINRLKNEE